MSFDLQSFIEFCRSKPAGRRYDTGNASKCALAQFGYEGVGLVNLHENGIPTRVYWAAVHRGEATFGALADRLEALR